MYFKFNKVYSLTIIIIFLLIFIIFFLNPIKRHFISRKYYDESKLVSKNKNKKLLVIGDPCVGNVNKFLQKIYPNSFHGDMTVDLYGCKKCDRVDINNINYWKRFKTNGYVIFETATLSFCNDIPNVLKEIKRISGGDFYSAGGTYSIFWKYIGNKYYSKKYKNPLKCSIYPFHPKEKYFKIFDFKDKKYKRYKF